MDCGPEPLGADACPSGPRSTEHRTPVPLPPRPPLRPRSSTGLACCATTFEHEKTSPGRLPVQNVLVHATERYRSFGRSNAVCAAMMILSLLVCRDGRSQVAEPGGPGSGLRGFEPASVAVPAGDTCALYPDGNPDPSQTITVSSDEDGVVRFLAVRPTQPDSVVRLALDCTDSNGNAQTYSVDLQSDDTFTPRRSTRRSRLWRFGWRLPAIRSATRSKN